MAKFLMMGKYSIEAMKEMSPQRTEKAVSVINKAGGKVDSMFALMGAFDLALIVEFPTISDAVRTSITLAKMTGIAFTTYPAITVDEFDKLISE